MRFRRGGRRSFRGRSVTRRVFRGSRSRRRGYGGRGLKIGYRM